MYYCGLDLGQLQDWTALSVLRYKAPQTEVVTVHEYPVYTGSERKVKVTEKRPIPRIEQRPEWGLIHVGRWRNRPYREMIAEVAKQLGQLDEYVLAIDHTGVGVAVAELAEDAGLRPVKISIHGGDKVSYSNGSYRVPKRDLVSIVQLGLQNRTLRIADGPDWTALVLHELSNFRMKLDPATAHDSFSSWREKDHDDIVLSVSLAMWASQHAARRTSSVPNPWSNSA